MPFIERNIHPINIIAAYKQTLEDAVNVMKDVSVAVDTNDKKEMMKIIKSCIGTKMVSQWSDLMCGLAYDAVKTVAMEIEGKKEIDIKRYARVEKIPGGEIEECCVLNGIMINKDVTHPKMNRRIENPRIVLLDCPLEYKKGESKTDVEVTDESHWARLLEIEEEQVKAMCEEIIRAKPDIVFTEKGVSGKFSEISNFFSIYFIKTTLNRPRSTLFHEGWYHGFPSSPKD